jgi:diguanylate cyclase (GGDEF)-like protein
VPTAVRPQSVFSLLLLGILLVTLIPIGLLSAHLYNAAWGNSWREIREKHQLLAQNMASPIAIYIDDHRQQLGLLAHTLGLADGARPARYQTLLTTSQAHLEGFRSLILLDSDGRTLAASELESLSGLAPDSFVTESCYRVTRTTDQWSLSRIKPHPVTGQPSLFMGQPVHDAAGRLRGVLLGELRIELIEKLRRNIRFGQRGHSAIVDQTGHVVAHPNPAWMKEMKDLSSWPVVKAMLAGKTGVTEFYSPFIGDDMVAGYASVPGIGWGVMVPQPKTEVANQVRALMVSNLLWAAAGLSLAVLLAFFIARWITRPIKRLYADSSQLLENNLQGEIRSDGRGGPRELTQLGQVLHALVERLQASRDEVSALNASLQQRVDEATRQLREANAQLATTARSDYLTSLANRRHFEHTLSELLSRRKGDVDWVSIMLIDIDHFKSINDRYGHAAGDAVLTEVAQLLEKMMRPEDLVARYGGDEFVAQLRCSAGVARRRAAEVREAIEQCAVVWADKSIHITVSIGVYSQKIIPGLEVETLLHEVDVAMYAAKQQGRNMVVDLTAD